MYEVFKFLELVLLIVIIYDIIKLWEKKDEKYYYREGKYYEFFK